MWSLLKGFIQTKINESGLAKWRKISSPTVKKNHFSQGNTEIFGSGSEWRHAKYSKSYGIEQ